MLTLKYPSKQRGPSFIVQVESSFNFLRKDLHLIAYRRSEKALPNNFTHVAAEQLQEMDFVRGTILKTGTTAGISRLGVTFQDNNDVLRDQDITVTILKSSHFGMSTLHGDFMAVAHFHAHIDHSDVAICSPDPKTGALPVIEITECKFDTLTFEQVGTVVRFPAKVVSTIGSKKVKRQYDNIAESSPEKEIKQEIATPVSKQKDVLFVPDARTTKGKKVKREKTESDVHSSKKEVVRGKVVTVFDLTPILDNSFETVEGECLFPDDVFEKDIVFVELPMKN